MTEFLKNNWPPIVVSSAVMIVAIVADIETVFWLGVPIIIFAWIINSFKIQKNNVQAEDKHDNSAGDKLNQAIDDYISGLEMCVGQEIDSFQQELQQLKSVFANAVVAMAESFNGLHTLTSEQSNLVFSLVSGMDETTDGENDKLNFQQFAEETDNVLNFFIEHILQVSKQSMEMVGIIHDVDEHMAHVEKLLGDVQSIADQTNLLALNAAIEAARAGEAGRGFAVVADEVRNLSRNSDKFSEEIREVVKASKNNINQAQSMIESMASKDMNITINSKANIDKMMKDIASMNDAVSNKLNEVSHLTGQIDDNVNNAVRGLQFEDMARQIVEYLHFSTQHFQAMADEMRIGFGVFKTGDNSKWINDLQQGKSRLQEMRQQWKVREKKVVSQSSMDEGDVDLF